MGRGRSDPEPRGCISWAIKIPQIPCGRSSTPVAIDALIERSKAGVFFLDSPDEVNRVGPRFNDYCRTNHVLEAHLPCGNRLRIITDRTEYFSIDHDKDISNYKGKKSGKDFKLDSVLRHRHHGTSATLRVII